MRTRTWVIFIVVNAIVSAVVMLIVLFVWNRSHDSPTPTTVTESTPLAPQDAVNQPTVPPASPTPPEPIQYTVQDGDTLGAIAQTFDVSVEDLMAANGISDPNLLSVGQTLVIPFSHSLAPATDPATETPSEPFSTETFPTPIPTLTPSGPPLVEIGQVLGAGDLETEVAVVRNLGGTVDMEGWTLSDAENNTFTFPTITLFADVQMRVHSIPGRSTPSDLYWGRENPAWNAGELVTLRDRTGSVIDTYIVP